MPLLVANSTVRRISKKRVFAWRGGAAARCLAGIAVVGASAFGIGAPAQATTYNYTGGTTGVWSTPTVWSPNGVPTSADTATFTGAAALTLLLGGNQAIADLSFTATAGTSAIRASAAGQILSLGTGGIQFGSTQTDLGGGGVNAMVLALMGSQAWTGTSGGGLIQLNSGAATTTQTITNGTAGAVALTFDGVSTGGKNIFGAIDDGSLGGTTSLVLNTTGTFGSLVLFGTNTYSGGTTVTQGFLDLRNNTALGTGALTFANSVATKQVSSGLLGGIALTNNNALNLNGTILLGGAQNIDFGTGATTLGSATILSFNGTTNLANFTLGGALTGAFGLTIQSASNVVANALLTFNGANTGNITAAPITLSGTAPTVKFGNTSAVPTGTGAVLLNGGAIAVGSGTAFAGATPIATFLADTRVTKNSGAIALTGDSSENFTAPSGSIYISLGAAAGSVARYTGTLTPTGANYNVGGGGGTIVFSNTNAFTGTKGLMTNSGITAGAGNSSFGAGGTTIITGQNTFNGAVNIGAGTLEVSSLNKVTGGTATSSLGTPTTAANGTINLGYSGQAFSELRYTGVGETTDRTLNFNGFSGATIGLDASGSGAVNFGGPFTQASTSNNRFLSLRGINTGANTITGTLGTGTVASAGGFNLTKVQRGNWTLTGINNLAATSNVITINGGSLTADYSINTANTLSAAANATGLTLGGGTLAMVNSTVATTATQTLGTTVLTANTGQSNVNVTGNGTAGSAVLTMGTTFTRNANTFLNFNLLNGGQVASTATLSNSVVVGTGSVAAFTVADATSADFATITGGQIAKLGAATPLPANGSTGTTNYILTGGQTLTASESANTVRIDTSGGGGTLTLGTNNLTLTGGTLLMSGSNAYTISGTRLAPAGGAINLANYGTGTLTVAGAVTDGSGVVTKVGPGLVDVTSAQAYTGTTNIFGGVLRLSSATFGTSNITLNTGGILEIGADLNGATAGDFSRQVGTGASQIQWTNGDGGFSAAGADRIVNLTNNLGVAGGQLVWGSTSGNNSVVSPNASPNFVKDGFALLLSSSTATGAVTLQNPIDFVNLPRTIQVGDGTAAVDAILSGTLSSSDYSGGLFKTGTGTLAVTGTNTYLGQTIINSGTLQLGNGGTTGSNSSSSAIVDNANLVVNRSNGITIATAISGSGTLTQSGTGTTTITGANTFAGGTTVSAGALSGPTAAYSTGSVTVNTGATADYTQNGASTYAASITGNGSVTVGANPGGGLTPGGTITYTGVDSAANTTVKAGSLLLNHTGGGALTGPVNVATGGTVGLNSANQIASTSNVSLTGGTLAANGYNEGTASGGVVTAQGLGTLQVGDPAAAATASTLDFGDLGGGTPVTLTFGDSSSLTWNGTVALTDYTDGVDQLYIGTTNDLSPSQLSSIQFSGLIAGQNANGLITFAPAPEPNSLLSLLVGGGVLGGIIARKRRITRAAQAA